MRFFILLLVLVLVSTASAMDTKVVVKTAISDYTNDGDIHTAVTTINDTETKTLTNGTGDLKANHCWADSRTVSAGTSEALDLAGSLTNAFGATLTFTKIKIIVIKCSSSNTDVCYIGGAASHAFDTFLADSSDKLLARPDGIVVIAAPGSTGYAVTAGTGDILQIGNTGGSADIVYEIIIIGEATTS